jgi:hypothetical protein
MKTAINTSALSRHANRSLQHPGLGQWLEIILYLEPGMDVRIPTWPQAEKSREKKNTVAQKVKYDHGIELIMTPPHRIWRCGRLCCVLIYFVKLETALLSLL